MIGDRAIRRAVSPLSGPVAGRMDQQVGGYRMSTKATTTGAVTTSSGGIGASLGGLVRRPEAGAFLGLLAVYIFFAIMGGAVFGDQCSPISDTTILSALACGSDLMDHVLTQLPIAMTAAAIAILLYTGIALGIA